MADRLLLLHIFIITMIMFFFLFILGGSVFFTMTVFASKVSTEQAGNLMVLALAPPAIITVVFLHKFAGKLYDRLHVIMIK